MASIDQARKAAGLIVAMDTLETWAANLDQGSQPYIAFGEIDERDSYDAARASAWDGELVLPREVALRMIMREIEGIRADLEALGISDSEPEPQQIDESEHHHG